MTEQELIAFEKDICAAFERGEISAPVHFAGGNEAKFISLFTHIKPEDWVLTSWRSHYHCLLKGVPPARVKHAILAGRSIALCFRDFRILSSAIVGGICPIAVGLAWGIKARSENSRVYCFLGDMSDETGIFHECEKYARYHELPVNWIIEDNGLSVCTDTKKAWGNPEPKLLASSVERYRHTLMWPHVGIGKWVRF